jgi:hypothetical protein
MLHHKTDEQGWSGRQADVAAHPPYAQVLPLPSASWGLKLGAAPFPSASPRKGLLHSSKCFTMLLCSMNRNAPKTH